MRSGLMPALAAVCYHDECLGTVAYGSKHFSPIKLKIPISAMKLLAIFYAFKEFGHEFLETLRTLILHTTNRSPECPKHKSYYWEIELTSW